MKRHKITGGGGVQLNVVETGNPKGRPIVFIHGFSQCGRAWDRQMISDLADDYRLVAMDMRGHGLSDKPADVNRAIRFYVDMLGFKKSWHEDDPDGNELLFPISE